MNSRISSFFAVSFALLAHVALADPLYQSEMTIAGYSGTTELTNFPLLVKISESRISGFKYSQCAAGGADLSFASSDGTTLPYEIDTWNTAGESLVWVKVPNIAGTTTKFYFRWCDTEPPANDPTQVWTEYAGVWHLGDAEGKDSTGHGFTATFPGQTSTNSASKIGSGSYTVGWLNTTGNTKITIPNYDSQNVGSNFTASGWFYFDAESWTQSFFCRKAYFNSGNGWQTNFQTSYTNIFLIGNDSGGQFPHLSSTASYRWLNYTVSFDNRTAIPYDNGTAFSSALTVNPVKDNGLDLYVGGGLKGTIDEIRIRKAPSSSDWVKAEYDQVEVASFITAGATQTLGAKQIEIDSTTEQYGTVSPAYGIITEPEVGSNYVFTCTQSNQVLIADAKRAVCRGWKLYRLPNNELIKSSADEGESPYECTYTYQQNKGVKIVWEWGIQYKVTATTRRDCTVTDAGGWLDEGTTFSATTAGLDVHTFHQWTDGSGATVESSLSLSKPVTSAQNYYALFTGEYWVATDGNEANIGSKTAPFATLTNAVAHATVDGDVIKIKAGRYVIPSHSVANWQVFYNTYWVTLDKAISVIGVDGPEKTIFDGESQNASVGGTWRTCAVQVNNSKAVLTGITISNCNTRVNYSLQQSGTLDIQKGIVTNCVIAKSSFFFTGAVSIRSGLFADSKVLYCHADDSDTQGGGLTMLGNSIVSNCLFYGCQSRQAPVYLNNANAKIYDCTITHCEAWSSTRGQNAALYLGNNSTGDRLIITNNTGRYGGGVRIAWGTLRNSIVAHNTQAYSASGGMAGGGVYLKSGTLENCTIVGNHDNRYIAHGVYQDSGSSVIRNCIINCNAPDDSILPNHSLNHVKYGGTCTYSCTYPSSITGTGNIWENPELNDIAKGDYALSSASSCFDCGQYQSWMATGLDVYRNPRISGTAVNMGAVETPTPAVRPLKCSFTSDISEGASPLVVKFTSKCDNLPEGERIYEWTFGDGETSSEEHPTHTYTTFGTNDVQFVVKVGDRAGTNIVRNAVLVGTSVAYAKENGSNQWPYDTEEKAASDIPTALKNLYPPQAGGKSTLHLCDGTITSPQSISILSKSIEIIGNDAHPENVILKGKGTASTQGLFDIQASGLFMHGVTIENAAQNGSGCDFGAGITMTAGVISNCVLRKCSQNGSGYLRGALNMSGGTFTHGIICDANASDGGNGDGGRAGFRLHGSGALLVHSIISNCTATCVGAGEIADGVVSNCLIWGCTASKDDGCLKASGLYIRSSKSKVYDTTLTGCRFTGSSTKGYGPIIYMNEAGLVRNCLIVKGKPGRTAAILADKGTVDSCTIADCTNTYASVISGISVGSSAAAYNTLVWNCFDKNGVVTNAVGTGTFDHCLTDVNPLFNPHPKRAYHPTLGSPAVNAGVKRDWMTADTLDLDGRPRVKGLAPDIGCFEHPATGFMLLVR